jgi:phage-related holin
MIDKMPRVLITVGMSLLSVFAPAEPMCLAALSLIFIDLISGVAVARFQKKPITSGGLKRSVIKFFVYETTILVAFIVQNYLTNNLLPVMNVVSSFIGITELLSILENINILSGGDLLKTIIDKLSSTYKDGN